jgi:predicted ATPase/DNA-binding winged helix-turn-helix (wHTH) protein
MTPAESEECYAFASFHLFPNQRALVRGGEVMSVGSRAFDMLLLLVERAGKVVSISDFMQHVWTDITVEEANLRVQVGSIRKVLSRCDEAKRAIETIPLRGYCFVLPVVHTPGRRIEPPRPASGFPASIPALLSEPVGRDDVIAVVEDALRRRRLVTITGPGGIGKTTVAIATATRIADSFDGPVVFVDLTSASDYATAAQRVSEELGLEPSPDPFAALSAFLCDRSTLLILDTCEHIVEPAALLVEQLLQRCAELHVLVTSREALRAAGEWTHRLASLTFPEAGQMIDPGKPTSYSAIELFLDRLSAATRYEVDGQEWRMVAEICRRLDGIPLALEFAAARVADLGVQSVARHLDDRFAILTRGRRTALPRHHTLAAALDWSFGLLSTDEQRLLGLLATHDGPFTVETAVDCGQQAGCDRPLEALSGLYEKSLLSVHSRDDPPTFRLMDTIRAYVVSRQAA